MVGYITSLIVIQFYQQVCLAQAQECILEKSMLDNRKATSIGRYSHNFNTVLQPMRGDIISINILFKDNKYAKEIAHITVLTLIKKGLL